MSNGWVLPDEVLRDAPTYTPRTHELADLELLLTEVYTPLTGFLGRADLISLARTGRLTNGTSWPVPITLEVPTELVNQMAAAVPGSQEYTDAVVKLANLNVDEIPVVQLVDTPNIFAMTASIKGAEKGFGTIPIQPQPAPFESIK